MWPDTGLCLNPREPHQSSSIFISEYVDDVSWDEWRGEEPRAKEAAFLSDDEEIKEAYSSAKATLKAGIKEVKRRPQQ